jgi:hypothetical protein
VASCHVEFGCYLTVHLGDNDLFLRRCVRRKTYLLSSLVTCDARNSCFKDVEIEIYGVVLSLFVNSIIY